MYTGEQDGKDEAKAEAVVETDGAEAAPAAASDLVPNLFSPHPQ